MKYLLLIAIAFTTLQTTAQDHKKHKRQDRMEMMKELSPEERATINTKRMTLQLDLNETQQSQIQEIMLLQAAEKQQHREARQKEKSDEKKKLTKESFVNNINEKLDREIEMKSKMKAILSPDQYEKWELSKSKRHKKGKPKHKKKARH